jgi:hypothetical protein
MVMRRIWLCAALLGIGGLSVPVPAAGQTVTGYVGGWEVEAFCGDIGRFGLARMDITAPPGTGTPGVSTTGAQRLQWFAWQALLYYAPPGGTWSLSGTASWRAGQVTDPLSNPVTNYTRWYDYGTRSWDSGWPYWTLYAQGTYGIVLDMWWYADAQSAGGHVVTWVPVTNGVSSAWTCVVS